MCLTSVIGLYRNLYFFCVLLYNVPWVGRSQMFKNKPKEIVDLPKSLWGFYRQYVMSGFKKALFCAGILILLSTLGGIINPFIDKAVITVFENRIPADTTFWGNIITSFQHFLSLNNRLVCYAVLVLLSVFITQFGFTFMDWIVFTIKANVDVKIKNKISEILTKYAHNQSISFWSKRLSGSVESQINYIINGFDVFYDIWRVSGHVLVILINALIVTFVNKYIAMWLVFSVLSRFGIAYICGGKIQKYSSIAARTNSLLSGKLIDSFSNFFIVKYFAGEKKEEQALKESRANVVRSVMNKYRAAGLFKALPDIVWDIGYIGMYVICAIYYGRGVMGLAEIIYATSVYYGIMDSVSDVLSDCPDIIDNFIKSQTAYKDLVIPITIKDKPNAKDLIVKKGIIEFRQVVFGYRNRPVLNNLSLYIKSGERVGIVGTSGSGKTTLVHLLMRFYEPKCGQILIDGQDISDNTQDSLHRNIAFIPQEPAMFNRTIGENIGYSKFGATKTEITKSAKSAFADEFIMATDKKYDSLIGEKGIKLSGGQRQRIAIARAFLKDAPILVLDEATSALDSETEVAIQESFEKLSKGRTTIAIAHRLSTLRNMDRIIVLDKGVIVEQGTHQQLLRKKGKYYQLWQMQSGGFLTTEVIK